MAQEKETVPVKVYFGFQVTHVSDVDGELVTTTYEPGQEVEMDAEVAREEEHRNRVRIIRPEPAPGPVATEASVAQEAASAETPAES